MQHIPLNWLWTVATRSCFPCIWELTEHKCVYTVCVYFTVYRSTIFPSKICGHDDFINSELDSKSVFETILLNNRSEVLNDAKFERIFETVSSDSLLCAPPTAVLTFGFMQFEYIDVSYIFNFCLNCKRSNRTCESSIVHIVINFLLLRTWIVNHLTMFITSSLVRRCQWNSIWIHWLQRNVARNRHFKQRILHEYDFFWETFDVSIRFVSSKRE